MVGQCIQASINDLTIPSFEERKCYPEHRQVHSPVTSRTSQSDRDISPPPDHRSSPYLHSKASGMQLDWNNRDSEQEVPRRVLGYGIRRNGLFIWESRRAVRVKVRRGALPVGGIEILPEDL